MKQKLNAVPWRGQRRLHNGSKSRRKWTGSVMVVRDIILTQITQNIKKIGSVVLNAMKYIFTILVLLVMDTLTTMTWRAISPAHHVSYEVRMFTYWCKLFWLAVNLVFSVTCYTIVNIFYLCQVCSCIKELPFSLFYRYYLKWCHLNFHWYWVSFTAQLVSRFSSVRYYECFTYAWPTFWCYSSHLSTLLTSLELMALECALSFAFLHVLFHTPSSGVYDAICWIYFTAAGQQVLFCLYAGSLLCLGISGIRF